MKKDNRPIHDPLEIIEVEKFITRCVFIGIIIIILIIYYIFKVFIK